MYSATGMEQGKYDPVINQAQFFFPTKHVLIANI